ncbi:hypothetical protein [Tolumonas auensis]|uniref:hypothetical protein n=1 Tax=Tolumonas auensis TaxID=43948 RepID=UPI002AA90977|nr:hypothetical protein [Tolumonas auensis]
MILCKRSPFVSGDLRSIHRRPGLKNLFLSLLLLSAPALLQAHEGHDHEEPAPASSVATNTVKRATAQSELFEIVAVPKQQQLIIYLDRFTDNTPVTGATVELESDGWQGTAKESSPGVYTVTAPFLAKTGRHSLLFTLTKGDDADLLETTIDMDPSPDASTPVTTYPKSSVAIIFSASAVTLLLLFILLRRRRILIRR